MAAPSRPGLLGRLVVMLLVLDALLALADLGNGVVELGLLADLEGLAGDVGAAREAERALEAAGARRGLFGLLRVGALVLTAAPFLAWFHGAYARLRHLGGPARTTPGWAVAGWFIPLGNLYLPYRAAREIEAGAGGGPWGVFVWWTTWLGAALVDQCARQGLNVVIVALEDDLLRNSAKTAGNPGNLPTDGSPPGYQ